MTVDAAVKGCCESCKKPNAVGWRGRPCAMGNVGHARPNYRDTHVRWKHLSSFTCRDVREALDLSQWRATSEGTSFSKWGKQVTEKSHEADESDNSCYWSIDVCV